MKKIWLSITIMIIAALLINVISADTVYTIPPYTYEELGIVNSKTYSYMNDTANSEIRTIQLYTDNTYYQYAVSKTQNALLRFKENQTSNGIRCNTSKTENGIVYYYGYWSISTNQISNGSLQAYRNKYGTITPDSSLGNDKPTIAIYYTYGQGGETITYGNIPIEYSQNLFTKHPENNLDLIRWYGTQDNNGNDLSNINLEIQAVAGYFQGSSYADLKTSTFTDWQASTHPAVQMFYGNYVDYHSQEYRWGDVATEFRNINTLGTWFWNIFASENTWYQYGWRYRYRLCDENNEPLTEWEFIYTGNSYTPSATEILTDPEEPLTPDTVDTINDINNENNVTNNWYINNTVINNNEYNQTYQQNIIQNIYNVLTGTPDPEKHQKAYDIQQTIDNAIDTEDNYLNDLSTQLTDLELPDISQQTGLLKALRWVREVHKETIEETLLGPIVLVILTIGLITYLIGRRNG